MFKKTLLVSIFLIIMIICLAEIFPEGINHYEAFAASGTEVSQEVVQESNMDFTFNMGIVIALVVFLIVMFIWEPIRIDFIALSIPVILVIFQKWTEVTVKDALSGFANRATIIVLAMFILSAGVYRSGIIQTLGEKLAKITGENETRQIGIISGLSGVIAGIINNTPVVALFIPMVKGLARKTKSSPSKLLIPLSFGAMMGGMLTLFGTNTNLLASDISARLISREISIFEFTHIGFICLSVGLIYLVTIGRYLLPERIEYEEEITREYEMGDYLTEVRIKENSPLVGKTVGETFSQFEYEIDLVEIVRNKEQFVEPLENKYLEADDHLIIRTEQSTLLKVLQDQSLELLPDINVTQAYLETREADIDESNNKRESRKLIEVVIPRGSFVAGQTLSEVNFVDRYNCCILAIRRGEELTHIRMEEITLKPGDILLIMAGETTLDRVKNNPNFIVSNILESDYEQGSRMFLSVGILLGVIVLAVFNILPVVIAALGGVLLMVGTGCLEPGEVYESVNWEIIFLLAGVIPLGIAIENTGIAKYLASRLLTFSDFLPPLFILGLFYIITALLTNVISRNASIVFMIPIAVDAAGQLSLNPFAFVLVVTFAAGCSFLTPVGNQINLMTYGAGGYRFRDFLIIGAPLQLIFTVLVPVLISLFFPL
ncbi:MAG: SLC13 family permease [Halothermotrichaceae bacterium]